MTFGIDQQNGAIYSAALKRRHGFAVAAFIIGIVAALGCLVPYFNLLAGLLGLVAVIFALVWLIAWRHQLGRHLGKGRGLAVTGLVAGLVAMTGSVTGTVVLARSHDGAGGAGGVTAERMIPKVAQDQTDAILAQSLTVAVGDFQPAAGQGKLLAGEVPVTVTNRESARSSYTVNLEAVGPDGTRIATDTLLIDSLDAGQSQDFRAFGLVTAEKQDLLKAAEFRVYEATKF